MALDLRDNKTNLTSCHIISIVFIKFQVLSIEFVYAVLPIDLMLPDAVRGTAIRILAATER